MNVKTLIVIDAEVFEELAVDCGAKAYRLRSTNVNSATKASEPMNQIPKWSVNAIYSSFLYYYILLAL